MLLLTQMLYLSILAITRIPVSRMTMPIALAVFVVTSVACMAILEKLRYVRHNLSDESQRK